MECPYRLNKFHNLIRPSCRARVDTLTPNVSTWKLSEKGPTMMTEPPSLTPGLIDELRNSINPDTGRKYTYSDIGRMFGVTRQAVSAMAKRYDLEPTPEQMARDAFPWTVPDKFQHSWMNLMLRLHGRYMATGGVGIDDHRLVELNYFYDKLERLDAVVEYDPSIPPSPDNKFGGFAYRKRRKSDGDLIIRLNKLAEPTENSRRIYRMPPRRPFS